MCGSHLSVRGRLRILASAALVSSVWSGIAASGQKATAAELPHELSDALRGNVEALSPVTVVWEQQLGSRLPIRQWLAKVQYPAYGVDEFEPAIVTYCWQDGMSYTHRLERKANVGPLIDSATGKVKPDARFDEVEYGLEESEAACNLEDVFFGHGQKHRRQRGVISSLNIEAVDDPKLHAAWMRLFRPDYFYEAGFILPDTIPRQKEGAKSLLLDLVEQGAEVTKVEEAPLNGHECLSVELSGNVRVLGTEGVLRFYLDPSLGYAVRRREERTLSGELAACADMSDFVRLSNPDLWLPKRCRVAYYTWYNIRDAITPDPLHYEHFEVQRLKRDPIPLERFTLNYTVPGTIVSDASLPQAKDQPKGFVRYVVPADPEDLEAAIQFAIDGRPFVPKALRRARRIRWVVIGVINVVIGGAVVWLIYRRRARAAS